MLTQTDLQIEISGYENWKDFHTVAKFLRTNHSAKLVKKIVGPDAAVYTFLIDELVVRLGFDDIQGNSLIAENEQSVNRVKLLAKEIEVFLKSNL